MSPSSDSVANTCCVKIARTKQDVSIALGDVIVDICQSAIRQRGVFTIALSGGSLPSFLKDLPDQFLRRGIHPHFAKWHLLLADERCVPLSHDDCNMKEIRLQFLDKVSSLIPREQIHAIDESLLLQVPPTKSMVAHISNAYDQVTRRVLENSGGFLDLALLGFGPDGHTCSVRKLSCVELITATTNQEFTSVSFFS
jgi:6-phosphogluconolactonase